MQFPDRVAFLPLSNHHGAVTVAGSKEAASSLCAGDRGARPRRAAGGRFCVTSMGSILTQSGAYLPLASSCRRGLGRLGMLCKQIGNKEGRNHDQ